MKWYSLHVADLRKGDIACLLNCFHLWWCLYVKGRKIRGRLCACLCVSEEHLVLLIACCWKAEMACFQVLWVRLWTVLVWEIKRPTNFIQTLNNCIRFTLTTWRYMTSSVHQLLSAIPFKQVTSNLSLRNTTCFILYLMFSLKRSSSPKNESVLIHTFSYNEQTQLALCGEQSQS